MFACYVYLCPCVHYLFDELVSLDSLMLPIVIDVTLGIQYIRKKNKKQMLDDCC